MQGSPCGYSDLKCSGSTPSESPTTAGGRSLVGGEVTRNARSPECGVATIEGAGRAIGKPKAQTELSTAAFESEAGACPETEYRLQDCQTQRLVTIHYPLIMVYFSAVIIL